MCTHQDGERRRIPRPCAPMPAAIPIAPLQLATIGKGALLRESASKETDPDERNTF
jgi:hypothetical protein